MTLNASYSQVVYTVYKPDPDNVNIAHMERCTLNIYEGRVTNARIAREIPKGAVVEKVVKVDKHFHVDTEKALAWLAENAEEK